MPSTTSDLKMSMKFTLIGILFVLGLNSGAGLAQETEEVRFPRPTAVIDPHAEYVHEVLRSALKNASVAYRMRASASQMQQARAIYEMSTPHGIIDILWTMSTDERETQLIPVRIPIDKGLIGWRIPLVNKDKASLLQQVTSVKTLAAFSAGQEHDWPDVPILKANGLPVVTSTTYEPLFNMLQAGRFDYFPRSIFEIWSEYASHPRHNLFIDPHIILHYPAAYYFFVTPRRPKLAEDLRLGLEEMIKNGSFEKLFQKYNQASIKSANIKQRTVIELRNPLSNQDKLPLNRPELWFQP